MSNGHMSDEEQRTLSDKFMLRLPDGMRDRIKQAAARNGRSMNAEIIDTLEDRFPADEGKADIARKTSEALESLSGKAKDRFLLKLIEEPPRSDHDIHRLLVFAKRSEPVIRREADLSGVRLGKSK